MSGQVESGGQAGSHEWFEQRARSVLVRNEAGYWDFSDSLCTYSPESTRAYVAFQQGHGGYSKMVTSEEHKFLNRVASRIITDVGLVEAYVDLGPGTEGKENYFLHPMHKNHPGLLYLPVDVSSIVLEHSTEVHKGSIDTRPLQVSFEELPDHMSGISSKRFVSLGMTYSNYEQKDIHSLLKKIAGPEGFSFFGVQRRDRVDIEKLKQEYVGEGSIGEAVFNGKMKLLGLSERDHKLEANDGIEVWSTIKNPSSFLEGKGVHSGDRIKVFKTTRYDVDEISELISDDFDEVHRYDDHSSFVGFVAR